MQTEIKSPDILGPYTLIREIGRGGMSTVYAARDERDGQTAGLKLLSLPPGAPRQSWGYGDSPSGI